MDTNQILTIVVSAFMALALTAVTIFLGSLFIITLPYSIPFVVLVGAVWYFGTYPFLKKL